MGGAKCSYRKCSVKSDGKTHMFHYPVFNKIRCHQWITNARRLEFFNLTVSQLKNRVVCQHHFPSDNFMNYMMDKLKHDAVPTLDGPYCEPEEDNKDHQQTVENYTISPIDPEEIEVEQLTTKDKAAKLKVKFAEFLCSADEGIDVTNKIEINNVKSKFSFGGDSTFILPYKITRQQSKEVKKQQNQPMLVVPPFPESTHPILTNKVCDNMQNIKLEKNPQSVSVAQPRVKIISEKKIVTPLPVQGRLEPISPSLVLKPRERQNHFTPITPNKENDQLLHENIMYNPQVQPSNVIPEQILFEAQILDTPANRCTFVVSPIDKNFEVILPNPVQIVDGSQPQSVHNQNEQNNNTNDQEQILQGEKPNISQLDRKSSVPTSPNVSQSKGAVKMHPERIAAIEEKRNFNKRLRDMIEFCLDELDDPDKQNGNKQQKRILTRQPGSDVVKVQEVKPDQAVKKTNVGKINVQHRETRSKTKEQNQADSCKKVITHLSEEPNIPNTGELVMAALEQRLKNMEEKLLQKIDQNSQRILDLKGSIETTNQAVSKKESPCCAISKTMEDEITYKQRLFKEISQFLRPQVKSVIYEELFLNQFTKSTTELVNIQSIQDEDAIVDEEEDYIISPKRRKRRKTYKKIK